MKYDQIKELQEEKFRRLTGVKRPTFTKMVEILTFCKQERSSEIAPQKLSAFVAKSIPWVYPTNFKHKENTDTKRFYDWLRGLDLNQRPSGYEPDELPGCSTPRQCFLCIAA